MNLKVVFTKEALENLEKINKADAKRILDKIRFFCAQVDPLKYSKQLNNPRFGTYRFRIGDYRAIFDVDDNGLMRILVILTIKHRKDIYR